MAKSSLKFIGKFFICFYCLSANLLLADDFAAVVAQYGKPAEKNEFESLRKVIWKYPRREFTFINGKLQLPTAKTAVLPAAEVPLAPSEKLARNPLLPAAKVPTADLIKEIFNEVQSKSGKTATKSAGPEIKDNKRPARLPTLPLLPGSRDEEEEEEIG